jgi:Tol biopolymer transport system component
MPESADGNSIAFLRGQMPDRSELRIIPPLGGAERKIADINIRKSYIDPPYLSWLPDRRFLVVVDAPGDNEPEALFVVSVETREKRRLFASPGSTSDTSPAVSPDGRSLVFDRGELYVVSLNDDLTASAPRQLTDRKFGAQQPAWSADSKEIIVSAQRRLWRLNVSGPRERSQLPFVGAHAGPPMARPSRSMFSRTGQWNIYDIPASGGKPHRLTDSAANDNVPSFSRDGRWIYFASDRTGGFEIWKLPVAGGNPERVTRNGAFVAFESTNGSHLYYTQRQVGTSSLWRRPTAGGEPVKVLAGLARGRLR